MRQILFIAVFVAALGLFPESTFAQSGSRSGGSGFSGAGGGSFSGSGFGRYPGPRLSAAEQAELIRREAELRIELQKRQAEFTQQQRKQLLSQLGTQLNGKENKRQNRLAFEEAKKNFQALNLNRVTSTQLGFLQQPFRLRKDSLNRSTRTIQWPSALQAPAFQELVEEVETSIRENKITHSDEAIAFLEKLSQLNKQLNVAAVRGDVQKNDYALARRMISGLANELETSGISLEPQQTTQQTEGSGSGNGGSGTRDSGNIPRPPVNGSGSR